MVELNDKTVEELRKMASKKKIEGRSKMNKADLVRALKKKMKGGMNNLPNNVKSHIKTFTNCKDIIKYFSSLNKTKLQNLNWDDLPVIPINVSPEVNLNIDCAICSYIENEENKQKCRIYYNKCRIFDLLNRNIRLLNHFIRINNQEENENVDPNTPPRIRVDLNLINKKMLNFLLMTTIPNTQNSDYTRNEQNFLRLLGANIYWTFVFRGFRLTSVTIPDLVQTISIESFKDNLLTSVSIPNSVIDISHFAFENNNLTNVILPNSLQLLGSCSFKNNKLTSIVIPNSVSLIGRDAFRQNQLTSIVLPDTVVNIERGAFQNNNLTSIVIPNSVTKIGYDAFYENPLTTVTIPRRFKNNLKYIFGTEKASEIQFTFTD